MAGKEGALDTYATLTIPDVRCWAWELPLQLLKETRTQKELGRLGAAVLLGDPDEDVFRGRLGVLHKQVGISVLVDVACVYQIILELVALALVQASPSSIVCRGVRNGITFCQQIRPPPASQSAPE